MTTIPHNVNGLLALQMGHVLIIRTVQYNFRVIYSVVIVSRATAVQLHILYCIYIYGVLFHFHAIAPEKLNQANFMNIRTYNITNKTQVVNLNVCVKEKI